MVKIRHFGVLTVFILFLGQLLSPFQANGQILEVGPFGGLSYYLGDINPRKQFNQNELGWGAVARFSNNSRWAFRFTYSNFNVSASDKVTKFREERGLDFKTNINDFSLVAEFNFFNYWTGSAYSYITPFIFGGVSAFNFSPYALDGTNLYDLQTEGTNYSLWSMSIPFGLGVKYSIGKRVGITLEWRMHKTFTDYIDDVSGLYPIEDKIVNGVNYTDPTDNYIEKMQRGDSTNKDWFSYAGISVTYKFRLPSNKKCDADSDEKYYRYY